MMPKIYICLYQIIENDYVACTQVDKQIVYHHNYLLIVKTILTWEGDTYTIYQKYGTILNCFPEPLIKAIFAIDCKVSNELPKNTQELFTHLPIYTLFGKRFHAHTFTSY